MTTRTHTQSFNSGSVVDGPQEAINCENILVSATMIAVIVNGDALYSVEYTLDDVNAETTTDVPPVPVVWFTSQEFPDGSSGTNYAAFYHPVQFVRINITSLVGDLQFKVLQSFNSV